MFGNKVTHTIFRFLQLITILALNAFYCQRLQANQANYDTIIQINRALANKNYSEAELLLQSAASRPWPEPFQELLQDHLLAMLELNPIRAAELKNRYATGMLKDTTQNQPKLAAIKLGFAQAEKPADKSTLKETAASSSFQDEGSTYRNQRYRNRKTRGQDLKKLIQLWTDSKNQKAKEEAYELARSAVNSSGKGAFQKNCKPFWAYAQYVLGRKARAEQNRKVFFERQMELSKQLLNDYCDAAHFFMPEDKFQEFKQTELLWAARLLWENNLLSNSSATNAGHSAGNGATWGAEELARRILQQGLEQQNDRLTLEAAQVLYGRILFESAAPQLVSTEIANLLAKMSERPKDSTKQLDTNQAAQNPFTELISYLKFRLALFHYAAAEDAQCAAVLSPLIDELRNSADLYNSLAMRKDYAAYLYWWARCEYLRSNEKQGALKQSSKEKLNFAFNELNKYAATSYYAMIFDADFPWVRNVAEPATDNFILREESSDDKHTKAIQKLEKFNELIQESELFPEVSPKSPLVSLPLKWLSNQLKNNEKQVFLYRKELMVELHRIFMSKEFNAELVLSAGRLAKHFRLDGPKGRVILELLYPRVYQTAFQKASEECKVDVPLLYAVSRQESLYEPRAESPAGAKGLVQLMPGVWNAFRKARSDLKLSEDPYHVDSNLLAGACHLHDAISYFRGNLTFALAGYNAGTAVARSWIERRFRGDERLFAEFIPFAETQDYVKNILRSRFLIQKMTISSPNQGK